MGIEKCSNFFLLQSYSCVCVHTVKDNPVYSKKCFKYRVSLRRQQQNENPWEPTCLFTQAHTASLKFTDLRWSRCAGSSRLNCKMCIRQTL